MQNVGHTDGGRTVKETEGGGFAGDEAERKQDQTPERLVVRLTLKLSGSLLCTPACILLLLRLESFSGWNGRTGYLCKHLLLHYVE